jgi:hypothetical protein
VFDNEKVGCGARETGPVANFFFTKLISENYFMPSKAYFSWLAEKFSG